MVFLKIQPYVKSSLQKRANHKLSFRYFGLYKIVEKIGAVAYHLQLPAYSSIHGFKSPAKAFSGKTAVMTFSGL